MPCHGKGCAPCAAAPRGSTEIGSPRKYSVEGSASEGSGSEGLGLEGGLGHPRNTATQNDPLEVHRDEATAETPQGEARDDSCRGRARTMLAQLLLERSSEESNAAGTAAVHALEAPRLDSAVVYSRRDRSVAHLVND